MNQEISHSGIKGQKWGERRYQDENGALTALGRIHYGIGPARVKNKVSSSISNVGNTTTSKSYSQTNTANVSISLFNKNKGKSASTSSTSTSTSTTKTSTSTADAKAKSSDSNNEQQKTNANQNSNVEKKKEANENKKEASKVNEQTTTKESSENSTNYHEYMKSNIHSMTELYQHMNELSDSELNAVKARVQTEQQIKEAMDKENAKTRSAGQQFVHDILVSTAKSVATEAAKGAVKYVGKKVVGKSNPELASALFGGKEKKDDKKDDKKDNE